jgi:hypothetical protein
MKFDFGAARPYAHIRMPLSLTRSDWQAVQLRVTVFPAVPLPNPTNEWWKMVVGAPPEEITTKFKEGSYLAGGPFSGGGLVLQVAPQRIDWTLQPTPMAEDDVEAFASQPRLQSVGPFDVALPVFRSAILRWLDSAFDFQVTRFAFGAVLQYPEGDRAAGYERLGEYLRIPIPTGSSDFLYQINLPTTLDFDDGVTLTINRLSKWSVSRFNLRQFTATIGAEHTTASSRDLAGPWYATRLELDVNTAPNPQATLPLNRLSSLFDELIELGNSCVEKGIGGND